MTIDETKEQFITDLRKPNVDFEKIVQKYLINAPTYFFNENIKKPEAEVNLKSVIATALSISSEKIFIVGSGKLGFSLKPKNLFNHFDHEYKLTNIQKHRSDLDIAIVSQELFETIGKSMYNYTSAYNDKWHVNEFYPSIVEGKFGVDLCYKCFEYYTKGWFRPDFKPQGFDFCIKGTFQDLRTKMTRIIGRKPTLAVYQNWFYFTDYHIINLRKLSLKLKRNII